MLEQYSFLWNEGLNIKKLKRYSQCQVSYFFPFSSFEWHDSWISFLKSLLLHLLLFPFVVSSWIWQLNSRCHFKICEVEIFFLPPSFCNGPFYPFCANKFYYHANLNQMLFIYFFLIIPSYKIKIGYLIHSIFRPIA